MYGCLPAPYLPVHTSLSYWAQAASIAGLPACESAFTSANLALSLKKSQFPLNVSDAIQRNRGGVSLRPSSDDVTSSFRVTSRTSSPPSGDLSIRLDHPELQSHHQQQQHKHHHQLHQQHRQGHHHHHHHHHLLHQRPCSASPPPVGSGIAPLQALCESDVSAFSSKSSPLPGRAAGGQDKPTLKFGMSRILSEDFGRTKHEKENAFRLSGVPDQCRSLTLCPCNSPGCTAYARPKSPYPRPGLPSLSAVHALQPPHYPLSTSVDGLPGPYSILSADSSSGNQPKRKRSWSRAVFSNLQRKGLEKRFEVQKYVTKPDRRQLAAMLGLTDAQVKVWFQNRRMKWRHAQQQGEKDKQSSQEDHKHQNPKVSPEEVKKEVSDNSLALDREEMHAEKQTSRCPSSESRPGESSMAESLGVKLSDGVSTNNVISERTLDLTKRLELSSASRPGPTSRSGDADVSTRYSPTSNLGGLDPNTSSHPRSSKPRPVMSRDTYLMSCDVIPPPPSLFRPSDVTSHVRSSDPSSDVMMGEDGETMDSDEDTPGDLEIDSDVDVNEDEDDDNDIVYQKQIISGNVACHGTKDPTDEDSDVSLQEIDVDN